MIKTNPLESSPPSTSSSSVGSDIETGMARVPPTPPRRTLLELSSPEPIPSALVPLERLSLDHAPPSESEVEESETEKPHAATVCEGCRRLEERLQSLQMEHTVS
ncbi:unnamed protein product [Hydatigera taeniaeformis]|uniref:RabBD domain-containing protein n=1 Tax=Hydatigena taeniaeformis TaxID=6205 RepID=A0A0R3WQP3_HYDTA|nr:unnamed protein product [Hydatigera taeniaeformis]